MNYLFRLGTFLRPYRVQVIFSLVLLLGLTAIEMIFPAIIQQVIDVGLKAGHTNFLIEAAGLVVGLALLKTGGNFIQRYITETTANRVGYDMRNKLYDHIQNLPFSFHDHTQSGQLISRVIEDVRAIQNFAGSGVIELLRVILLLIGIITILFLKNPLLAAISLAPMIPLVLVTSVLGQRMGHLFLEVDNALGEISSRIQENVTGVQVVRAFAREPYEIGRFDEANRELYDTRIRTLRLRAQIMPTTTLLVTIGTILILWFGGQMVIAGQISLGELVAFNSYLLVLALPAQNLDWLINAAGEGFAGVKRTMEILDMVPEIKSPPDAIKLPRVQGRIEFEHVDFLYRGKNTPALHDINLSIRPNQIIALIGPTGSGKTSLVNLVPRFYDITGGNLCIDGYDIRKVDLVSLREQIGLVLQTSLLFSASIKENIAYGRPGASIDQIMAAAKAAQAHDFIVQLPEGYDTVVGERGVTLSGGQRQRIAISRAILIDPRILILDDSTSSVDTQTERVIQIALDHLMTGRTTLIIAQRLSTVRRADVILVMDHGEIVQRGTHDELLKVDGLYRQIYDLQLREQERFQQEIEAVER